MGARAAHGSAADECEMQNMVEPQYGDARRSFRCAAATFRDHAQLFRLARKSRRGAPPKALTPSAVARDHQQKDYA
jgi:hypothetical protein